MYTQSFRELTFILPDLSPKESMQLYERGLQPRIRNEIYLKEPVNVDEMIKLAERVDTLKPGVGHAGPSRPALHQTTTPTRRVGVVVCERYKGPLPSWGSQPYSAVEVQVLLRSFFMLHALVHMYVHVCSYVCSLVVVLTLC